jgi:MFS family permease
MTNDQSFWKSKRLIIGILLFVFTTINYMDRTNLSVAAPQIAKEFNLTPGTMGIVFSSFLWTYALLLVPAGWMADRFGTKTTTIAAVVIWSIGAMLTGAASSLAFLLLMRFLLGIGESPTYPVGSKIIREWTPASERGLMSSIFNSGSWAGPAIGGPLVATLVVSLGWRESFFIVGGLGFVWLIAWMVFYKLPENAKWLSKEEKEYILSTRNLSANTEIESQEPLPHPRSVYFLRLIKNKTVLGLMLTQGCAVYTQYLFLSWLPSYLVEARHITLVKAGFLASLPYIIAVVLGIAFGRISDRSLTKEKISNGSRRNFVVTFMIISSVVLGTTFVSNLFVVEALLSLAMAACSTAISLNIALTNDLTTDSRVAGLTYGLLLLGGNILGLIAPILTGYSIQLTGSYNSGFVLAGVFLILGAFASFTMTRKPIEVTKEDPPIHHRAEVSDVVL